MNFAFNEDQDRLRDSVVRFLRDRIDLARLTAQGNRPDTTYDKALWSEIVALGWTGLIVPEEYGGLGLSLVDWVVITEEFGRVLAPCPYLGNYAGTLALLRAGSTEQKETLLPQIVSGEAQAGLAWSENQQSEDANAVSATVRNGRLNGTKRYVIDADTATHLIVSARDTNGSLGLYLVARGDGVSIEPAPWMDITRRVCTVTFDNARAETMPMAFDDAWPRIIDRVLLALASENAGGAESILRQTVAYANERIQFGKPIASYQAIKHKCADMMMKVESAKALTYYCAWALAQGVAEGPLAASMAKSFTSDAYRFCTSEAIQIHGAIGFTWEMTVHLYFKRARANAVMFGNPAAHRERVIQLVTAA